MTFVTCLKGWSVLLSRRLEGKHCKLGCLLDGILFSAQKWDFEGSFYKAV